MSTYAAIGYVIGIFIFAIIFRFTRKRLVERHIRKLEAVQTRSEKEKLS